VRSGTSGLVTRTSGSVQELADLLSELAGLYTRDELIDELQELEEFAELCRNLWILKLVVSICEAGAK